MKTKGSDSHLHNSQPDLAAGWVIGIYLVLEVVLLAYIGVIFWLASDMNQLLNFPLHPPGFEDLRTTLNPEKFSLLRQLALAACSAGSGGSVFMIREFYLNFAYGNEAHGTFLRNREIPRYLLLPFSSIILGPLSISLLQAGAIVFAGFSAAKSIPDYTIIAVSFLFGFSYHDSLKALRNISRNMFSQDSKQGKKDILPKHQEE